MIAAIQIVRVNQQYPQVEVVNIDKGQTAQLISGIDMQVVSAQWNSKEEAAQLYGEDFSQAMEEDCNYRTVAVTVELSNTTSEEINVSLYNIYLENNIYCNGLAPEVFFRIGNNQAMDISIASNEKQEVMLGYVVYELQFTKAQWNNMPDSTFYLADERYPIKRRWEI